LTEKSQKNRSSLTKQLTKQLGLLLGMLAAGFAWYHHVVNSQTPEQLQIRDSGTPSLNAANDSHQKTSESTVNSDTVKNETVKNDTVKNTLDSTGAAPTASEAQSLIDQGLIAEGRAMLEKIIELDPSNTQAMMELAMIYTLDLKEPVKSRDILEKILDINPSHRAALNELELIYKELGAVDQGLELLQLKAQQHPESLEIQYLYGRLLAAENPAGALPWLERATKITDQREQALDQLAGAALRAGKTDLAIKSWTEALSIAESELAQARANGEPGIDYLEDRISSTRTELARARQQAEKTGY